MPSAGVKALLVVLVAPSPLFPTFFVKQKAHERVPYRSQRVPLIGKWHSIQDRVLMTMTWWRIGESHGHRRGVHVRVLTLPTTLQCVACRVSEPVYWTCFNCQIGALRRCAASRFTCHSFATIRAWNNVNANKKKSNKSLHQSTTVRISQNRYAEAVSTIDFMVQ